MTLSDHWQALDIDSADGGAPPPPSAGVHVVAFLAGEDVLASGWAARAAVEVTRDWGARGSRVVLCDAGFEAPSLHEAAGLDNLEGLSDALLFGTSFQRLGQPLSDGLFLATAGTAVPDAEALRAHPRWRDFAQGFEEAGAVLVLYLPLESPGADALLELCHEVVVLARAERADGLAVPGGRSASAVLGPPSEQDVPQEPAVTAVAQGGPENVDVAPGLEGAPDLQAPDESGSAPVDVEAREGLLEPDALPEPASDAPVEPTAEAEPAPEGVRGLDAAAGGGPSPATDPVSASPPSGAEQEAQVDEESAGFDGELVLEDDASDAPEPELTAAAEDEKARAAELDAIGSLDLAPGFEEATRESTPVPGSESDVPETGTFDPGTPELEHPPTDTPHPVAPVAPAGQGPHRLASGDPVQDPAPTDPPTLEDILADGGPSEAESPPTPPPPRPRESRRRARRARRNSGLGSVLLLMVLLVILGILVAGWAGFVEIPGITPSTGPGVEEADAAEVASGPGTETSGVAAVETPSAGGPRAESDDGTTAGSPESAGPSPVAGWVLAVSSFSELQEASDWASTYRRAVPSVQFIVAPVEVDGRSWFRLLAGPARDRAEVDRVRQRLVDAGTGGGQDWIPREAGLAFLISAPPRLALAERNVEVLEGLGIPAYVLQYTDEAGDVAYRVYAGAYANPAEARYLARVLEENNIEPVRLTERRGVRP